MASRYGAAFRTFADVRKAFASVNGDSFAAVAALVVRAAMFMQAGNVSVRQLEKELTGAVEGTVKVGDIRCFTVASKIFTLPNADRIGIPSAAPRDILTMAARIKKQHKEDGAPKEIERLSKLTHKVKGDDGKVRVEPLPFSEWGKHTAKTNAPIGGGKGKGKGKGKDGVEKVTVRNLDDVIIATLQILNQHKEWRTTSQPELVAELSALLATVTTVEAAKPEADSKKR